MSGSAGPIRGTRPASAGPARVGEAATVAAQADTTMETAAPGVGPTSVVSRSTQVVGQQQGQGLQSLGGPTLQMGRPRPAGQLAFPKAVGTTGRPIYKPSPLPAPKPKPMDPAEGSLAAALAAEMAAEDKAAGCKGKGKRPAK